MIVTKRSLLEVSGYSQENKTARLRQRTMTLEEQNSLKRKLEKELQESEWLQKFKQLSEGLSRIKAEIPLTQLCELRWVSDSDSLIIHCPNPEVREGLCQQTSKIAQLNIGANCFIIKYPNCQDIIIEPAI
ncbi:MAG: hypothetical protein AB4426_33280 [Xenococcaceae cyanobacterium]